MRKSQQSLWKEGAPSTLEGEDSPINPFGENVFPTISLVGGHPIHGTSGGGASPASGLRRQLYQPLLGEEGT
jgi:hypothetical protein